MRHHRGSPPIALTTLFAAVTAVAVANDTSAPTTRLSREELVRKWDLNSDGKIDKGEAEVASSKMRLERAEMRLNSGIDPVTGRPRGEAAPTTEPEPPDADTLFGENAEPAEADAEVAEDRPAPPGTRVPRAEAPRPSWPRIRSPAATKDGEPATRPGPLRQPITGGVRGGGVAARPGYGGRGPAAPLNAGRPIDSLRNGTGGTSGPPQATVRGGLVPRPAPPRPTREIYDPY